MTTLTLREHPTVPLEAEVLTPDVLAGLPHADVRALPVMHGKRRHRLDEFFDVDGDGSEAVTLRGDLTRVKWVGRGMTRGTVAVHGNAGMHLGAYMTGGTITVHGNAADWVGGEMAGGTIRVHGHVGSQAGAAYRGSPTGMRGGALFVEGAAGIELGMRMKRGLIAVRGPVRDFAGVQMTGGTLVLAGGAELRTGAWMTRGTILSLHPLKLLPTFAYACTYNPSFLGIYARHLARHGFDLPHDPRAGAYRRYTGDAAVPGKGEVLCWQPHAPG